MTEKKLNAWFDVYEGKLREAVTSHPEEYSFRVERVPEVSARMREAFRKRSYNKDGRAIRMTCKELGIPHTYKAINAFLDS